MAYGLALPQDDLHSSSLFRGVDFSCLQCFACLHWKNKKESVCCIGNCKAAPRLVASTKVSIKSSLSEGTRSLHPPHQAKDVSKHVKNHNVVVCDSRLSAQEPPSRMIRGIELITDAPQLVCNPYLRSHVFRQWWWRTSGCHCTKEVVECLTGWAGRLGGFVTAQRHGAAVRFREIATRWVWEHRRSPHEHEQWWSRGKRTGTAR